MCIPKRCSGSASCASSVLRNFSTAPGAAFGKRRSAHSAKGEGKCRELDERVELSASKITDNPVVIDPKAYALDGIDDVPADHGALRRLFSTLLVDRLAAHFEKYTGPQSGYSSLLPSVRLLTERGV